MSQDPTVSRFFETRAFNNGEDQKNEGKIGSRWRKHSKFSETFLENWPLFLRYLSEDFFPGFHILESLDETRFHVYARGVMSARVVLLEFHSSIIQVSCGGWVLSSWHMSSNHPISVRSQPFFEPNIFLHKPVKKGSTTCWKILSPKCSIFSPKIPTAKGRSPILQLW